MKTFWLSVVNLMLLSTLGTIAQAKPNTLILAGGCFWCVESDFEHKAGVLEVVSGYTGGHLDNHSYEEVSSDTTGHFEAVKITFDDNQISLKQLVDYYWRTIDPTDPTGQFCDKGLTYRTALFYQSAEQLNVFQQSLNEVNTSKPFSNLIVTSLLPAKTFYPAESYHQNYATNNPVKYKYYRWRCGRDERVKELWGNVASQQP